VTAQTDEQPKHGRSVVAGVIQRLSVSQLKKHKLCPRAWFFQKVMRVPEPSTGAQKVGTDGHAQIEHYISTGENVLGVFALSGGHLLPLPGPDLLVEQQLDGDPPLMAGGVPFNGFIDLVNPRRLATEGVLRVTDHKFTSSVADYAATAEQLANADTEAGLQMVGYGRWALAQGERFPGLRMLELEHIYYQTRGPRLAESVLVSVPVEHIAHEWKSKVEPQVEQMKTHAQAARASDVPANFGPACSKYGGCPFMAKCLSGESKTMSLRDRLLNKSTAPSPEGVAAVVRNPPEQFGQCPNCGEQLTRENASQLVSGAVRHVQCPKKAPAILPPDAPPPEPVQPVQEVTPAAEQPAPAAEQPAPKRRGRPRKVAEPEQPAPAAEQPAPVQPSISPKSDRRVLFVDCIPTAFDGPKPEPLTGYVDTLHRKVSEAGGVDDVRFAGSDSALGFGKWRGALAMAARAELPQPGVYVALGLAHSELMQVVVEAIEPAFDIVVRSAR